MNILCIGNSFAVDASTYLHQIAETAGKNIDIYVLYIGGCPIDLHYKNMQTGEKAYELYKNGDRNPIKWCSIQEGLFCKHWDYITFQQVSGKSCDENTFFPELPLLMEEVRQRSLGTFLLHKTWAYSKAFSHEKYGKNPMNQEKMAEDIDHAYEVVSAKVNIPFIIPTGSAITNARKVFGDALDRDGYHLNERGRTLAGYLWAYYFLGKEIDVKSFRPSGYSYDDNTPAIKDEELPVLMDIAKKTLEENKGHNLNG